MAIALRNGGLSPDSGLGLIPSGGVLFLSRLVSFRNQVSMTDPSFTPMMGLFAWKPSNSTLLGYRIIFIKYAYCVI